MLCNLLFLQIIRDISLHLFYVVVDLFFYCLTNIETDPYVIHVHLHYNKPNRLITARWLSFYTDVQNGSLMSRKKFRYSAGRLVEHAESFVRLGFRRLSVISPRIPINLYVGWPFRKLPYVLYGWLIDRRAKGSIG